MRIELMDEVRTIRIDPTKPDREVTVGERLSGELLDEVIRFLQNQVNQFAWEGEFS